MGHAAQPHLSWCGFFGDETLVVPMGIEFSRLVCQAVVSDEFDALRLKDRPIAALREVIATWDGGLPPCLPGGEA